MTDTDSKTITEKIDEQCSCTTEVKNKPPTQDNFLNFLRKCKIPVSIYLLNGIKLDGIICSFDPFVVMLAPNKFACNGTLDKMTQLQMIYKHAISTISQNSHKSLNHADITSSRHNPHHKHHAK